MLIKKPDKIYHVWHYCPECGKVFNHSQGTWNYYKGEHCGVPWEDVSHEIESVTININSKALNPCN